MGNYRHDQLVRLLETLDRRTNTDDDESLLVENTAADVFYPLGETLSASVVVETPKFTPPFVWGDNTMIFANWRWGYGGRWA